MLNNLLITSDVSSFLTDFLAGMRDDGRLAPVDIAWLKTEIHAISSDKHLSFERWWQILERLEQRLKLPAIGLEIGKFVKVEHFGCLGYLLKTSRNLEQALRCFERFQRLLYDGNKATLEFDWSDADNPQAFLVWQADFGYSSQISDELLISSLIAMSQDLLEIQPDMALRPTRIDFTNPIAPELQPLYLEYFDCEVRFSQPNLRVGFPARLFELPIIGSDENLHQLLNSQALNLLNQAPDADSNSIASLHSVLARCLHEGDPTAEAVAEKLHMSTRSLHRRLKENGLVFRNVLRETRKTLARQYLADDKISLPEIALMLGYSEQSAFNRAFRQWFGESPAKFKKAL